MSSVSQVNTSFDIRACGINPNHWYAIARSTEVREKPLGITLWHQPIVLYRDDCGVIHALEDRCPHRQVKLSHGADDWQSIRVCLSWLAVWREW